VVEDEVELFVVEKAAGVEENVVSLGFPLVVESLLKVALRVGLILGP
jgi:hypothetical protein